ncbi:RagB/SusD family nutrient uptake outer membrane protein [Prevotella sp. MA2016]|uniref:RagB/SusD family nutrient uptake outer membrane protein n=1 Tax=Prevotella sp. MA2016 TaxID=1408310 RepID=UPI0009E0A197|nr:RagB/SusD family nutrient uptake outer membrane protein [Prevotella sp. MA2016]
MKKYILSSLAVLSAAAFTSCNDMLDTDPRVTEMTQATFPGKPADVEALNAATYSIMNTMGGGDSDNQNIFFWWEVMSDDCYGSGGLQDNKVKSLHHLVEMSTSQFETPFILLYGGISRANNQIETIDNVPWTDKQQAQRNQLLGEAYFMRGLYTLWLTQLFGDVPLITSTTITPEMEEQVSAEDVIYPQILSDFVSAKSLMGTDKGFGDGHANKYVAEAFIARAYMFWAGFYKKVGELATGSAPAITLVEQEGCSGSLSQADVVSGLKEIIGSGAYKLCEDYRSLWQYSNSLLWAEAQDDADHGYAFIKDMKRENCFDMPGMGNGNTEELFQIQFMNASSWNIGGTYNAQRMYSNYISVFWGLRNGASNQNGDRNNTYPFNQGWGQGTPSCNIWDDWTDAERSGEYTDLRKKASLIDLDNELAKYTYEKDDCEESGYSVKKYAEVNLDACGANNDTWWSQAPGYTSSSLDNKMQGDHFEDFYLMRYADVLLMATELTGDASYMNLVQKRAGVPETPYSLKAVQNERRWEFAFEGLRFNDLRRWSGKDAGESSIAAKALQAQAGKKIVCLGDKSNKRTMEHMTCSWAERYAATNGFLAKPQTQITLMNGKIEQNPGWDAADAKTQYKVLY